MPERVARAARPGGGAASEPVRVPREIEEIAKELKEEQAPAPTNGVVPPSKGSVDYSYYRQNGPGTFTGARGIILKIRPFSMELASRIQRNLLGDRPEPPKRHIASDNKDVIDTNDPDYLRALAEHINKAGDIAFNVRVSMGTSFLSAPEDIYPPDDDRWIEYVSDPDLFGIYAPKIRSESPKLRYLDWMQYYALSEGDIKALYALLEEINGVVKTTAVDDAVDSFRNPD